MTDSSNKGKWTELLKSVEFFKPFIEGELDEMLEASLIKKYPTRGIIIKEDQEADTFYVILSGKARVVKKDKIDVKRDIMTLDSGDCFGEMAILLDETRAATIVAKKECTVFVINKDEIDKLRIETREKLYRQFAIMISKRLKYNLLRR